MQITATLTIPKLGELLLGNAGRAHNRIGKQAVREELEYHHTHRIPGHFTRSAHGKYGYKNRQVRYIKYKTVKYGHNDDLVRTGASRSKITGEGKVSTGGTGDTINGKLTMRFDFEARVEAQQQKKRGNPRYAASIKPRKKPNVTIEDMKSEVRRILPAELKEISAGLRRRYVHLVKTTTGARQQVKV